MLENFEAAIKMLIELAILLLEGFGAIVILVNTFISLVRRLKRDKKESRETLTEGISFGLSFLLSSEVLKTIVAPGWKEIGMTCAVLLMRAGMTFLIKWEEKQEREEEGHANQ